MNMTTIMSSEVGNLAGAGLRFVLTYNSIIDEIIKLGQKSHYQDVTIICQNGYFQSNSFLLAALFPMFRDILNASSVQNEESYVISMPDMDKNILEDFCEHFHHKSSNCVPDTSIQELLDIQINVKEEDETLDSILESDFTGVQTENNMEMINDPLQINIKENYSKVKVETMSETKDQCDMI